MEDCGIDAGVALTLREKRHAPPDVEEEDDLERGGRGRLKSTPGLRFKRRVRSSSVATRHHRAPARGGRAARRLTDPGRPRGCVPALEARSGLSPAARDGWDERGDAEAGGRDCLRQD